jgi:hypothetical protein
MTSRIAFKFQGVLLHGRKRDAIRRGVSWTL